MLVCWAWLCAAGDAKSCCWLPAYVIWHISRSMWVWYRCWDKGYEKDVTRLMAVLMICWIDRETVHWKEVLLGSVESVARSAVVFDCDRQLVMQTAVVEMLCWRRRSKSWQCRSDMSLCDVLQMRSCEATCVGVLKEMKRFVGRIHIWRLLVWKIETAHAIS